MEVQENTGNTGIRNSHRDLIDTLHQALKEAKIYEQYIQDANGDSDIGLQGFFNEMKSKSYDTVK